MPPAPDLAVVEFDDAFGALDPDAQQQQARRPDGSVAPGVEWVVPPKPKVRAVARLKQDPLGRMFHRHQLDQASFLGGREYQRLYDSTQIGLVRSIDWSKTKVSGGHRPDPLTDGRQRASRELHFADDAVLHRHGVEGLSLVRDVLCEHRSVEAAGRLRGADGEKEVRWFVILFRKCLALLAAQFGFANLNTSVAAAARCASMAPMAFPTRPIRACTPIPPSSRIRSCDEESPMGTGSKGITHLVGVPAPLQIEIAADVIRGLRPEAARRGLSVAALVRDLLDVVAADRLVSAILDDADREP